MSLPFDQAVSLDRILDQALLKTAMQDYVREFVRCVEPGSYAGCLVCRENHGWSIGSPRREPVKVLSSKIKTSDDDTVIFEQPCDIADRSIPHLPEATSFTRGALDVIRANCSRIRG